MSRARESPKNACRPAEIRRGENQSNEIQSAEIQWNENQSGENRRPDEHLPGHRCLNELPPSSRRLPQVCPV